MNRADYDKFILGKDSDDIGSCLQLRRKVVALAKKKGYATGDFHKMKKRQLKAIYYNFNNSLDKL